MGCFPFSHKFRKFWLGGKWKTLFWFAALENSQNEVEHLKGCPVFPAGNSRMELYVPFARFPFTLPVPGP